MKDFDPQYITVFDLFLKGIVKTSADESLDDIEFSAFEDVSEYFPIEDEGGEDGRSKTR